MNRKERDRLFRRLAGDTAPWTEYILVIEDDCSVTYCGYLEGYDISYSAEPEVYGFPTLGDALAYLKKRYADTTPCPEDGRILV